jgi:hypothetical protein
MSRATLGLFGRIKEKKRLAMRSLKLDPSFLSFTDFALMKAYHLFC